MMNDHTEMAREALRMVIKQIKGELKPPLPVLTDHYLLDQTTLEKFDTTSTMYPKEWRKEVDRGRYFSIFGTA